MKKCCSITINHNVGIEFVMLVEIPDPEVILSVIIAFVVGLGGLYGYYKIKPFIKSSSELSSPSQDERLEYFERQLIDMKIRLDALEIQGVEPKSEDPNMELKQFLEKLAKKEMMQQEEVPEEEQRAEIVHEEPAPVPKRSSLEPTNPTDFVLRLITNKAMTSRDIQITLKRSREHTSRLMKKLFEDGYVQRNVESKPYTYSITEKGIAKIENLQTSPSVN